MKWSVFKELNMKIKNSIWDKLVEGVEYEDLNKQRSHIKTNLSFSQLKTKLDSKFKNRKVTTVSYRETFSV